MTNIHMKGLIASRQLYSLGCNTLRQTETCRALFSSTSLLQKGRQAIEKSEVEAADPFLSKLQQQTEASYLELLSRKDQVPQTEDDQEAEEKEEVSIVNFCHASAMSRHTHLQVLRVKKGP